MPVPLFSIGAFLFSVLLLSVVSIQALISFLILCSSFSPLLSSPVGELVGRGLGGSSLAQFEWAISHTGLASEELLAVDIEERMELCTY